MSFLSRKMNALNTHRLRIILPNTSRQCDITPHRLSCIEKALFLQETTHMYLRMDSHKAPLHPVYKGPPVKVWDKSEKYFVIDFRTHSNKVTIDRLKFLFFALFSIFILHSRESELYRYTLDGKSALAWELPFSRFMGHLSST